MTDKNLDVFISGGLHAGEDTSERIEEITQRVDNPDLLLIEERDCQLNLRQKFTNWLSAPLLLLGIVGWLVVLLPILRRLVGGSDSDIMEDIQTQYDIETKNVDRPVHSIIKEYRGPYTGAHYAVLWPPVLLFAFSSNIAVQLFATALIISGSGAFMLLFMSTPSAAREEYMATKIFEASERAENDVAILLVGGRHAHVMHGRLERMKGVNPISEEPEKPSEFEFIKSIIP